MVGVLESAMLARMWLDAPVDRLDGERPFRLTMKPVPAAIGRSDCGRDLEPGDGVTMIGRTEPRRSRSCRKPNPAVGAGGPMREDRRVVANGQGAAGIARAGHAQWS